MVWQVGPRVVLTVQYPLSFVGNRACFKLRLLVKFIAVGNLCMKRANSILLSNGPFAFNSNDPVGRLTYRSVLKEIGFRAGSNILLLLLCNVMTLDRV